MELNLKGNDMILISKLIKKLKLRAYLRELKKELKDQDSEDFNETVDMGFIFGDLAIYIYEQLSEAMDEVDNILKSALNKTKEEVDNLTLTTKADLTVDIIKNSVPKSVLESLDALNVKKNSNMTDSKKKN